MNKTERQFDLANLLVDEMKSIGSTDARVDGKCYVYGTVPATPDEEIGHGARDLDLEAFGASSSCQMMSGYLFLYKINSGLAPSCT